VNMNVDVDNDSRHVVASAVDVASAFAESPDRFTEVVTLHGGRLEAEPFGLRGGEYLAGLEEVFGPVDSDKQRPDHRGTVALGRTS
jgi:hypothetical protein